MQGNYTLLIAFFLVFGFMRSAAQVPAPGAAQSRPIVLTGATLHIGNGSVIENGALRFENGRLAYVGPADARGADPAGADVRDVSGRHVYPGIIVPATTLGLVEIGAVRATLDMNEVGRINPNARAIIAYNTDSRVIPTVRSNGILLAQITPQGGLMAGSSSVVQLDAWNWEDAAYKTDDGVWMNWPSMRISTSDKKAAKKQEEQREKNLKDVRDFFTEAAAYCKLDAPEALNLRFEAMRPVFGGQANLYVETNDAKSILAAVKFTKEFGITPVIVGGADAWMITEQLKADSVAIILAGPHRMPRRRFEAVDMPFKTPALLKAAGIPFCISGDGSWDQRNLPFLAGTSVAHGLDREAALEAITLSSAKILGIADRTGSLEVGKDANIIVSAGDVLDMRGNDIQMAFIQGREVDLDNKQEMLYRKFSRKYGIEE